ACVAAFVVLSITSNVISQLVVLWYFMAFAVAAIAVSRMTSGRPHAEGDEDEASDETQSSYDAERASPLAADVVSHAVGVTDGGPWSAASWYWPTPAVEDVE